MVAERTEEFFTKERTFSEELQVQRVETVSLFRLSGFDVKTAICKSADINNQYEKLQRVGFPGAVHVIDDLPNDEAFLISANTPDLEIHSYLEPHRTNPQKSEAKYLAKIIRQDCTILIQYVDPHKKSSPHSHNGEMEEVFCRISGKLYVHKNRTQTVPVGNRLVVKPNESHLVFTASEHALTFIAQGPGSLNHQHENDPPPSLEDLLKTIKNG